MPNPMMTDEPGDLDQHADRAPLPPQDREAEQAVLGAMLLSKDAIGEVAEIVRAEDFYRPAHQAVYTAIMDLYGRGEPADALTVDAELARREERGRVGGAPYLHTLIASVSTAVNASYHADLVATQAIYRRLTEAGMRITQDGYAGAKAGLDADHVVDQAQGALADIAERRVTQDFAHISELTTPMVDELDAVATGSGEQGISTGFTDLDRYTNGLKPGQMVIVAARPGLGKSTLAMDMCRSAVRHGEPAAIFSLEMGRNELTMRLTSAESRTRLASMSGGYLSDDDWATIGRTVGEINEKPLWIDDSPNLTMSEIRAKARRLKQRHGLRLLVVDYLQLMMSGKRVESRQQEVSEFSRQLKLLAKELDVAVVAISQLNRGPEQRADNRPMLADLRESGSLEQDSDLVILLHRPDAYERDSARAGEADLILAKHRGGPVGTVTVTQQLHYSRFADLATE